VLGTAYDRSAALLVCIVRDDGMSADRYRDELQAMTAAIRTQDRECASHPRGPICLVWIETDIAVPDAKMRAEIATLAKGFRSPRHCLTLVTRSSLVRGVLRAITWIAPPRPGHHVLTADDLPSALRVIEEATGEGPAELRALVERARARR